MRFTALGWIPLVAVPLLAGCSGSTGLDDEAAALAQNRALWAVAGSSTYELEYDRMCFCGVFGRLRLTIEEGEIVSGIVVETDEPIADTGYLPTVEGLFDLIGDAIEREAFSMTTAYDADLGHPLDVSIDYEEFAVDEEMGYLNVVVRPYLP